MRDPNPDGRAGEAPRRSARRASPSRFADDPAPFEEQNEEWLKRVARRACRGCTVKVGAHARRPRVARGRACERDLSGAEARALTMRLRAAADAVAGRARRRVGDRRPRADRARRGRRARRAASRCASCSRAPRSRPATRGSSPTGAAPRSRSCPRRCPRTSAGLESAGVATSCATLSRTGVARRAASARRRARRHARARRGRARGCSRRLWRRTAIDELVARTTAGGVGGRGGAAARARGGGRRPERWSRARCARSRPGSSGDDAVTVWRRADDDAHDRRERE